MDMVDEETPLLIENRNQTHCKSHAHIWLMSLLTDWPWDIAAFISGNETVAEPRVFSCLQWLYTILRMFIIIIALFTEAFSSFRQDRLDNNSSSVVFHINTITPLNATKAPPVTSSDNAQSSFQMFGDIIIIDLILIALLLYVLFSRLKIFRSTDIHNIDQLIKVANDIQPDKLTRIFVVLMSFSYIISSIGVSSMYLCVYFKHTHVIWPMFWKITGSLKASVIVISLLGTFATDLFYIQIILRYTFRCQLNIQFLLLIIGKVENDSYTDQDEAIKDVERSRNFVKQLNTSSRVIGFMILLAFIQATNCAINLLHDFDETTNSQLEEVALLCRLVLWIFLTIVPFYYATKVNETSETLSDSRLVMIKIPALFKGNTDFHDEIVKKNTDKITIKAKLFGIPIPPWGIYVTVIVILLGFALRSVFELYKHLLWY